MDNIYINEFVDDIINEVFIAKLKLSVIKKH